MLKEKNFLKNNFEIWRICIVVFFSLCHIAIFSRIYGAPEKSRTPNLQIRSLALYPIELRALLYIFLKKNNEYHI